MKEGVKNLKTAGHILLAGAMVILLAVACSASAVWGS
jgi:hypothetical protein